jgi:acyl-coenzyme A thioesterase PaaI-like protein
MNALAMYQKFERWPAGRWLFSRLVCFKAPYFASIGPNIQSLEQGRIVATIKHRRRVQNHIGTVHAIALCNLAEFCAGTVIEAFLPRHLRWIPKGMSVQYLKKASGLMRAEAELPALAGDQPQDVLIHVPIKDPQGQVVFSADITMYVTPRPAKP